MTCRHSTTATHPKHSLHTRFRSKDSANMEHSHPPQEAVQSMAAEPDPNYNPSRMRKLGQNAARLARKMASTPTGSSSPVTTNTAPTGETPDDHLQAALPPACALPPGLPPPPGLSKPPEVPPPGLHPPPGFTPVVPREKAFGSRRSPPSRRPGGTHLENCHSLSKTRVVSWNSCILVSTTLFGPISR